MRDRAVRHLIGIVMLGSLTLVGCAAAPSSSPPATEPARPEEKQPPGQKAKEPPPDIG
jgi:hypothetical protein